ncbi:MAG: hypothetical protein M1319_04950 [Chloroflexi bacterium]|nr:hypothetical protein [Chloroflexota bacterium]
MVEQAISRTRTGIIQALSPKIILPALVLVTGVMYLSAAAGRAGLGFPLDDSWIHQTIARNIALHGEYTFNLHQPMSGSTAPLWTVLLAIGYFTPGGYLWFTYALGLVSLLLTALVVYELAATFYPAQKVLALVAAVFYVLEWRSGWSALSGMETPLFTLLCCLAFLLYARGQSRPARWIWPATGLAAAAATFLRPEGLGIFLVLIAHSLWQVWWQKRAVGQPAPLAPLIKRGGGQVPLISGIRGGYLYGESPTPPYQGGTLESPPDKGDLGGFVHRQGLTPPSHRRAHRHAALQGESTLAPGLVLAGFLILAGIGYAAFNYPHVRHDHAHHLLRQITILLT